MSNIQLEFTEDEILAQHPVEAPNIAGGVRCHGGFDKEGTYFSPRTLNRVTAIGNWQQHRLEQFGTPLLDIALERWPEHYPNVPQAKFLISKGIRQPIMATLTRVGTVEGMGGAIRGWWQVPDVAKCFDEDVQGTAISHLAKGLIEAHARDEAGYEEEGGHMQMWYAARDIAFEKPLTEQQFKEISQRMGFNRPGGGAAAPPQRPFPDIDERLETAIQRMMRLLLIEIGAYHTFAWAEKVLSDRDLVAGDGAAARLVTFIRQDESPHVEYLKTVFSEMRDRTFVGDSGKTYPGTSIINAMWDRAVNDNLGQRAQSGGQMALNELNAALGDRKDAKDIIEEFHSLGTIRPNVDGAWKPTTEQPGY